MSMMKKQLEKLAERVTGDIEITDTLMAIVEKNSIRQATEACWEWTDENGKFTCGGIGALANFINNGCSMIGLRVSRRNPVRLSSDANGKWWTIHNGG